jgi:hypothetical protein
MTNIKDKIVGGLHNIASGITGSDTKEEEALKKTI